MLICPQCQSENPDTNNFCQECGNSLTQKSCFECGSQVPFDAQQCPNCGALVGTLWQAIFSHSPEPGQHLSDVLVSQVGAQDDVTEPKSVYLDSQRRYKVLEFIPLSSLSSEVQLKVLDCRPFQLSPLEMLLRGTASEPEETPSEPPTGSIVTAVEVTAIPAIAQPYLQLRSEFLQALPHVHDAWYQDGQGILLIEDRSHFPKLLNVWCDEQIPPLQIVHWLHEMTSLWGALEAHQTCQSLLELTNLCVDEDQVICLQRLYPDPSPGMFLIKDLGRLWQSLFDRTQKTQFGSVALVVQDLASGTIQTVDELQQRLEMAARQLQSDFQGMPDYQLSSEQLLAEIAEELPDELDDPLEEEEAAYPGYSESADAEMTADLSSLPNPPQFESSLDDPSDGDDTPTVVLPMQLVSLEDAGRTDIGRQRNHNEDSFGIQTELHKIESPSGRLLHARGLYVLCDGMGGHAGGEVASALAVETIKQYFQKHWFSARPYSFEDMMVGGRLVRPENQLPSEACIREAVQAANQAIFTVNQQNARSGSGRMGTTLVLVLIDGIHVAVAHVGDSRLYRLSRRQGLEQVTADHDVGQREIQRGVEAAIAYARPDSYQLTQALGPRDDNFVNPDVKFMDLNEDTLLLLCSDGLTDNDLLEANWQTHLEPLLSSQANLERGVSQLIDLANQYNGHDNITALTIRVKMRPNLEQLRLRG